MPMEKQIEVCQQRAKSVLQATDAQIEHGLELHRSLFICDCFGFAPSGMSNREMQRLNSIIDENASGEEVGEASLDARTRSLVHDPDLRARFENALRVSGVDCLVQTVGVGPSMHRGLRHLSRFSYLCDSFRETMRKAISVEDVRAAYEDKKFALVWSGNNPPAMGPFHDGYEVLRWIEAYYFFGIRLMHLTYNRRNWIGDGCTEPTDAGLSDFGREVVAKLNRTGIIVDTPHSGRQTTLDAARFSNAPIMASHTACQSVYDHPRGKSDEELKAIAGTNGMAGMCCIPYFLAAPGRGTIASLLDHIDYAVKRIGCDHVGIGTDTSFGIPTPGLSERKPAPASRRKWWSLWPEGTIPAVKGANAESVTGSLSWICWPYYTVGLVTRGYKDEQIGKIMGGNFLRVLGEVQTAAE